jgi:hypothetical protein
MMDLSETLNILKMLRNCTLLTLLLALSLTLPAQKRSRDSVSVTIHLNNRANSQAQVDSVYLIFDRWDLTGAGLVKKIYYPEKNTIKLEKVPKGRYYIEVICLGTYPGRFNKEIMAHPRGSTRFSFRLKRQEYYSVGAAKLPQQKVDFSNLSIYKK